MKPMPCLRNAVRLRSESRPVSTPLTNTEPVSGVIKHPSKDRSVVLPLPDGHIIKVAAPEVNVNDTSLSAGTRLPFGPYATLTRSTAMAGSGTEHLGRLNRQRRLHGNDRGEDTHCQRGREHRHGKPVRR